MSWMGWAAMGMIAFGVLVVIALGWAVRKEEKALELWTDKPAKRKKETGAEK